MGRHLEEMTSYKMEPKLGWRSFKIRGFEDLEESLLKMENTGLVFISELQQKLFFIPQKSNVNLLVSSKI